MEESIGRLKELLGERTEEVEREYIRHDFNLHRWLNAYQGDVEETAKVLSRHLHIRRIMGLSQLAEDESSSCPIIDKHAPISILGRNKEEDNLVTLWELTGLLDIHGLVQNIRISRFMKSRFRWMERVHRQVVDEERRSGRQGGALYIMDLQHISFSPSLLSIIAGPYRIMWGTLFEQYPQMIQRIVIINAPTFINLLFSTCKPFIPDDFLSRITIVSTNSPCDSLLKYIDKRILPSRYIKEESPFVHPEIEEPQRPFPQAEKLSIQLTTIRIPAGSQTFIKLYLEEEEELTVYTHHDSEVTCFWFYSQENTTDQTKWEEAIAGCERPALPTLDILHWTVPRTGYYTVRYGNEKAWFLSVSLGYSYHTKTRGILTPIQVYTK